ncbi:MAG: Com family DNA-binding transcriptional regulator [Candidatus Ornithomonoglobus sp.]
MLLICLVATILIAGAILLFFLNVASYVIVYICLTAIAAYGIYTFISLLRRKLNQRRIDRCTPRTLDINCRCGQVFRAAAPSGAADYTICCPYCGTCCHVTLQNKKHSLSDIDKRSIIISAAGILALLILIGMLFHPMKPRVRYYTVPDSDYYYDFGMPTESTDII